MNKILIAAAIVMISSSAIADQKTPITPSLPAHVGTDIEGNKVIHNAPNQPSSQQEEQDGSASDTNSKRHRNSNK